MLPVAYIVHQIQGRMRIRIPSKRRDQGYLDAVAQKLRECEGIRSLETNALTGSILITHNLDSDTITAYLEQSGLFTLDPPEASITPFAQGVADQLHNMDDRLKAKTWGVLDFSGLAFLSLVLASAVQLTKRNVWPAGGTLLWYALSVLPSAKATREGTKP